MNQWMEELDVGNRPAGLLDGKWLLSTKYETACGQRCFCSSSSFPSGCYKLKPVEGLGRRDPQLPLVPQLPYIHSSIRIFVLLPLVYGLYVSLELWAWKSVPALLLLGLNWFILLGWVHFWYFFLVLWWHQEPTKSTESTSFQPVIDVTDADVVQMPLCANSWLMALTLKLFATKVQWRRSSKRFSGWLEFIRDFNVDQNRYSFH